MRDTRDPKAPHDVEIRVTHIEPFEMSSKEFDVRLDGKGDWVHVTLSTPEGGLEVTGIKYKEKAATRVIDEALRLQAQGETAQAPSMPEPVKQKAVEAVAFNPGKQAPNLLANLAAVPFKLTEKTNLAA